MSLTIEDGSLVANADSYASVAEAQAYATSRGLSLPATDGAIEVLLRQAADYLDSLENRYKGNRVESDQALAWPRSDVYLFDSTTVLPETEIPVLLKRAQCQLAVDANTLTLQPTGSGQEILKQKVDVIEVEYAERGSVVIQPEFTKALAMLEPLFKGAGGFTIRTVRV